MIHCKHHGNHDGHSRTQEKKPCNGFESRDITRRNFLKGSALAAAGGLLAACAPAAAPAGEAPAADEDPAMASDRLGGTLVFGYPQKTSYQDLLAMEHNAGNRRYYLIGLTHNCLINISTDYTTWLPELAESWEFDGNRGDLQPAPGRQVARWRAAHVSRRGVHLWPACWPSECQPVEWRT